MWAISALTIGPRLLVERVARQARVRRPASRSTWKLCSRTKRVCSAVSEGFSAARTSPAGEAAVDDRQVVAGRGRIGHRPAAGPRPPPARAIDHRAVEPAADRVDGGGRVARPAPVAGSMTARPVGITLPGGKMGSPAGMRCRSAYVGRIGVQVDVVVDELAPGIHHAREALRVGRPPHRPRRPRCC